MRKETEAVIVVKEMIVDGKRGRIKLKKRCWNVVESYMKKVVVCEEDVIIFYR